MSKHFRLLLFFTVVQPVAVAAGPGTDISKYSCEYRFDRYGVSGGTQIAIRDGKIQRLEHHNHQRVTNEVDANGYPLRLGFNCSVDADRGDKEQVWRDHGRVTAIDYAKDSLMEGSALTIRQTTRGFLIDMSKVQYGSVCGANAETPITLFLSKSSKRCEVKIRAFLYDLTPIKRNP